MWNCIARCGPIANAEADDASCPRYALYPADGLQQWFESLELSTRERDDMVGRTRWAVRMFGDARHFHIEVERRVGIAVEAAGDRRGIRQAGLQHGRCEHAD